MKKLTFILALTFMSISYVRGEEARLREKFDFGWKFRRNAPTEAIHATFDDSQWQSVDLPHDWSIHFDFTPEAAAGNDGGYLPTGKGTYRKTFPASTLQPGGRQRLYIEGAYMNSVVYVNGKVAGGHPYGYTSYDCDITPYLRSDSVNVVAITIDNSRQRNSRWYSGSGLYRHVWLETTNGNYEINPWSLTVVTGAPDKKGTSTVDVAFDVANLTGEEVRALTARVVIGNQIVKKRLNVAEKDTLKVDMSIKVKDAQLWSPETPALYEMAVELIDKKGNVLDRIKRNIGIRTFSYSADGGFILNGKRIVLNGSCVHHDNGVLGAASYDAAEIRKVHLLKEGGFNAVRTSHNIPSPAFLDACDNIGLLVINESFDGWEKAKTPHDYAVLLREWWERDITSMVNRDQTHPSIIAWSTGNEIIERESPRAIELAKMFGDLCRKLDPSNRPITHSLAYYSKDWERFDSLIAQHEIIGYNYMIHKAPSDHERVPNRVIWQTESYARNTFRNWAFTQDYPYVIGDFIWTGIDYLGESGIGRHYYAGQVHGEHWERSLWPWHGALCGDIDLIGHRKPISYYRDMLYNSVSTNTPYLYMAVREPDGYKGKIRTTMWSTWPTYKSWNWKGHENKTIEIEVISTLPRVALLLNGKRMEEKQVNKTSEYKAVFKIPYTPGTLVAVGYDAEGKELKRDTIVTAGTPVAIRLQTDRSCIYADGQDLAYVTAELVDAKGNVVPDQDCLLLFTTEGDATIAGTGNADMTDASGYYRHERLTHYGRALAVIKAGKKSGKVTVTVLADKLQPTSLDVDIK
ncbi:glycoside hydrolase family 2 protein [Bacteroides sp. UBA939]|uniref:glycoside hydrolase family 2 protein n=1 Tax=Bacteroides sp. UBA939 TaxID=1946092 RepID=UPI0025C3291E|nr:glycoside hydrolase family 2 TIM barrel-domain containing protein [Bacteroides sp. UBA939]